MTVAPSQIASFLAKRGAVGLCALASDDVLTAPCGAVLLLGDDGAELVVDLEHGPAKAALATWLSRPGQVAVMDSARPQLRRLLRAGIDVARPTCTNTLARLLGRAGEERARLARDRQSAKERAAAALQALPALLGAVEDEGQRGVARLESLVLRAFAALEDRGLPIDRAGWSGLVDEARGRMKAARGETFAAFGDVVGRDLFGEPDLSLDNDADVKLALERLCGRPLDDVGKHTLAALSHPAGKALLVYREAAKIVSTYGEGFLAHVSDEGRVRATFIPLGACTGRVASRDPNLQNLPSDAAFHRCVRPGPGRRVVTADYATCELRILAELAGDERFLEAFARGDDLHSVVAQSMFGEPVSKTENPHLRKKAKAINFGLVYGMGASALGAQVGVSASEASELLERYFERFPKIRGYLEGSVDEALARGYAKTILGRRLRFDRDVLASKDARQELSRIAKNMPIQGTSADMTKLAMVRVHERLRGFRDAGLINTVHDELVAECREADAVEVARAVGEEMGAAHETLLKKVPPLVEVHVGEHWQH
jgi:DNA polymerase I